VDLAVAAAGLIGLAPVLAAIAALVRLSSPGPVIFRQERVGRHGRRFVILKFRTMIDRPTTGPLVSGDSDPNVTGIGSWLRRSRLDELPQLLNLLRGDLTLVGPRPEVPRYVAVYTDAELQLLRVRPGIIGPGAVLFARVQAHELDDVPDPERYYLEQQMHPRLALDLEYISRRGVWRDVRLVTAAVAVMVRSVR
jgi:lipopolysaccharide/colanic/teichoic acid biosynthesis glycosyltransferase